MASAIELYSSAWHIFSLGLVFFIGLVCSVYVGKILHTKDSRSIKIYLWHTMLCLVYMWYVRDKGGDALMYYEHAFNGEFELNLGTASVKFFTFLLIQGLGLSFAGAMLCFNILGCIGLQIIDTCFGVAIQGSTVKRMQRLATLIIFLPSISFWSSAIGKDSIALLAVGLSLWSALALNRRLRLMIFAILIMFVVRPHIAAIMIIGLCVALVLDADSSLGKRLLLSSIAILVSTALIPIATQYSGVDENESIDEYVTTRQSHNMEGGGGVDISSMSLPMQLFTYVFRPTLLEINNITSLFAALDNTVILYVFIIRGYYWLKNIELQYTGGTLFLFIYTLGTWIVLAMTTANLGIAIRQKWMFVPMLIFTLLSNKRNLLWNY